MNLGHLAILLLLGTSASLHGQALPTASRVADVQVGAGFVFGHPDYATENFRGISAYADVDVRPHLGAEFTFHQVNSPSGDGSYQRTYQIGARYLRTYGPLVPYVRGSYGRGDFNYPYSLTDLSYNLVAAAAGADYKIGDYIHLRAEYEYENWFGFTNGGLHPQLITLGVAYRFSGKPRYN